jgi:hypothetical protein
MYKNLLIKRSDNFNTRHSKRSFYNKLKRKAKKYYAVPFYTKNDDETENTYLRSSVQYENDIEYFCKVNHLHKWKPSNNIITFEDKFCLFEDSNKVIRQLLEMLHTAKTKNHSITKLNYKGHVSFGALYLIDNFCWEIGKKRIWQLDCQNITETEKEKLSKLRSFETSSYDDVNATMINERVPINRSDNPLAFQRYKVKAKDITDMLQNALRINANDPQYELNNETYAAISSTIGEHFDNIQLHAKDAMSGFLCGFYDKFNKEITILIYNFGKTIADTLNSDSIPNEMKSQIDEIIGNHTNKKFFLPDSSFTKENAVTLLAIQEGISSRLKYDRTRGHGMMDFIEHCFELSNDTKIVIISGKTSIKIDKTYKIGTKMVIGRNRRILALNDENNIYNKPNSTHVKNMTVYFPGVLIETTIPLNI